MISPQYTPFNAAEVAKALGLSNVQYQESLDSGILLRSVRNEYRCSDVTALHSLVDVVRFAAIRSAGWPNLKTSCVIEKIESHLDIICFLIDFGTCSYAWTCPSALAALVFRETDEYASSFGNATCDKILHWTAEAWVNYSFALSVILDRDRTTLTA